MEPLAAQLPIARVVVDVPARAVDRPFDYLVPAAMADQAVVGAPVVVGFGERPVLGWVVERRADTDVPTEKMRPLVSVAGAPLFGPAAPVVASWIAYEYVAPLSDALRLFLPPGGAGSVRRVLAPLRPAELGDTLRQRVYDAIEGGTTSPAGLTRRFGPRAADAIDALVDEGFVSRDWRLIAPDTHAVDDRVVELVADSGFTPRGNAVAQLAVLDALAAGPLTMPELTAELGSVGAAVKRLEEAGAVAVTRVRRFRDPAGAARPAPRHAELSAGQTAAVEAIAAAVAGAGGVVLVDGVTGSGKTEVYLRAIEAALEAGRGAIVLVPEISLTPQTVGRFRSRFGDAIAVLHSRLSAGERYDQWDRARLGHARVVVGARSALFAPVADLGLIVIDEEHESSYKQGSAPRYDARAVARRLAQETGAALVLGSATPSLESIALVESGAAVRAELPERVAGGALPSVEIVDMGAEFKEGHKSMFSRALARALADVAEAGDKAVLFLNRRGFASFLLCRECGFVPECPDCDVSLTYHDAEAKLVCHHCGHSEAVPPRCPVCSSPYLRRFGTGTQRVEAELAALLPDLPVVRMDADTTAGKGGHERQLARFEALESGVLLGTQMVAKGLDYPEVTLVGVVNADTTLHLPDYRAAERTFQLLEQVAGRAGRGERPGRVIVQTYWPEHPALLAVARHDRSVFYTPELLEREELGYPPAGRLANIGFTGEDARAVEAAAAAVADAQHAVDADGVMILGPSPAPIARVQRRYRWHVLLKAPPGDERLPGLVASAIAAAPAPEGVSIAPDVDPADLL